MDIDTVEWPLSGVTVYVSIVPMAQPFSPPSDVVRARTRSTPCASRRAARVAQGAGTTR
ncbi:hypothetical protein [Paraburkholderia terrae]|uniref:Uncharacterized protein n=1 Tax=Paraburkholderia terrae TaxID=311230 RepID=A0ABN6JJN3_9BURK|nr:hypothetical protein [Paraburkholderia terrae]BCZ81110.1 hypothetical protein PTKU64_47850 [Paraburkholderia terrae]BDC40423.1 hypothetical protein PTKU15_37200 [Paraburkholderia terrae]